MEIDSKDFSSWLLSKGLQKTTIKNYLFYFDKFKPYGGLTQEKVRSFMSSPNHINSNCRGFLRNYRKFLMENYREFGLSESERLEISEIDFPKITGRRKSRMRGRQLFLRLRMMKILQIIMNFTENIICSGSTGMMSLLTL